MERLLWVLVAFLFGGPPFAVWIARLRGVDPLAVGDGDADTINAWKIGGWLVAVALAPVLGHAFSPFLLGRGGKDWDRRAKTMVTKVDAARSDVYHIRETDHA